MFERFTDRARRVVVLAQEEARALQHDYIGTEHLLLGLLKEGEGVAAKALTSLGIAHEAAHAQIKEIVGLGRATPSGHIPMTPRAKKVLELSLREALQLGHNYIGTEHQLLGIVREGEGVAMQASVKLGVEGGAIRKRVIEILSGFDPSAVERRRQQEQFKLKALGNTLRRNSGLQGEDESIDCPVLAALPSELIAAALARKGNYKHGSPIRILLEELERFYTVSRETFS